MSLALLIVDDEPLARLRLRSLVEDLAATAAPGQVLWTVAGEAATAQQALGLVQRQAVQAVLLDIQLPGQDGLQLAAQLRALPRPPAVVFVTAHEAHALQAFELDAADYLTKPVRLERLRAALARVAQRLRLPPPPAEKAAATEALVISERGRVLRLPVAELLYFKAEQKQVLLRTPERTHLIDDSLTELETRLATLGGRFIRVHRNALVALGAMRELQLRQEPAAGSDGGTVDLQEGWAVRVAPMDEWLSVSRRQVAAVRTALTEAGLSE